MKDPLSVFGQAFQNLKPGGWFEAVDTVPVAHADDDTLQNAPNTVEWCKLVDQASANFGKRMVIPHLYKQWMTDAGFQNVEEAVYKVCLLLRYYNPV